MMEREFRRTIFVPVGTSLMTKATTVRIVEEYLYEDIGKFRKDITESSTMQNIEWNRWCDCFGDERNVSITFFDRYVTEIVPSDEIQRRKSGKITKRNPEDRLTAELASLYLFYEGAEQDNDPKDEIILLASDTNEGLYCACFLAEYLLQKEPYKNNIGEVHVKRIIGLDGGDSDTFGKDGIDNLISHTTELIKERQDERSLYLNVTGGYKGVLPYLVLLGLSFGELNTFYLFESSPNIVWLPRLPVAFDLFTWRNYRGFVEAMPHLKTNVAELFLDNILPAQIGGLFEKDESKRQYHLTTLGMTLKKKYKEEKEGELTPYGRGYLLVDKIHDKQKQKVLRDCINRWQYLWLGDLIPETVEHARGHTQRVLELAAQILYPILNEDEGGAEFFGDENKTDNNLLALISAIWLHDLGHSGEYIEWPNVGDKDPIEYEIKGFPSLVRELHHVLSWYLIDTDKNDLFRLQDGTGNHAGNTTIFSKDLIEAIRQICLYHRGRMPVLGNDDKGGYVGIRVEEPLESLQSSVVNIPLLGALLRIADGGDVQEERTISPNYKAMRFLQNDREIEKLEQEQKELREKVAELFNSNSKLPDYLNYLKDFVGKYPCNGRLELDDEYQKYAPISKRKKIELQTITNDEDYNYALLNHIVDNCVQKYIQGVDLKDIDAMKGIILRNWLSALDQYVFKRSPPPHFEKHGGISAVMYRLASIETKKDKNEYHFKVLAIHKKDKNNKEGTNKLKKNAKHVLENIFCEYTKVKKVLNKHHIYFDSYELMMEEDGEKIPVQFSEVNC